MVPFSLISQVARKEQLYNINKAFLCSSEKIFRLTKKIEYSIDWKWPFLDFLWLILWVPLLPLKFCIQLLHWAHITHCKSNLSNPRCPVREIWYLGFSNICSINDLPFIIPTCRISQSKSIKTKARVRTIDKLQNSALKFE